MATWYVSPSTVTTTGAGTREQPFKANAINWTPITAGDTIYLRTSLGTYNETLTIGKSGTSGNYIIIDSDPLDGGRALIDGQGTRLEGITQSSKTYIWIKNITVQNTTGANNRGFLSGSNWKFTDVEANNCYFGLVVSSASEPFVDGGVFSQCTYPVQFYNVTGNITAKRIRTTATTANNIFRIGGSLTTGVLTLDDFVLDGGTVGGLTNAGLLYIDYGVFTGLSTVKNIIIKNSAKKGVFFTNCSGFSVTNMQTTNNGINGLEINNGCNNINFYSSVFNKNADDGIDFVGDAHDINLYGCIANGNGYPTPDDPLNSGDGFSAHGTCFNINQYFCIAIGNRNTGYAHVNTSAGVLYHCTSAFNGNQAGSTNRAGIFINTTGDNPAAPAGSKSWKVKNCIGYKDYPRSLWFTAVAIGSTSLDFDYNSYKALDDNIFATINGGSTNISWTTYHATYEANSKNEDGKVTTSGMITYDSPCVDDAPWMTGVNDGGQTDPWGKKVYGLPNTGADQGGGMPISGIRSTGYSRNFH